MDVVMFYKFFGNQFANSKIKLYYVQLIIIQ